MTRRLQSNSFFTRHETTKASEKDLEPSVNLANRENHSQRTTGETERGKRRSTQDKNFNFSAKKQVGSNLEEENKRGVKALPVRPCNVPHTGSTFQCSVKYQ